MRAYLRKAELRCNCSRTSSHLRALDDSRQRSGGGESEGERELRVEREEERASVSLRESGKMSSGSV